MLASSGDRIYLDGTNTLKDPYTCQSGNSLRPGIYINKRLSLIGYGPIPPRIRCAEGNNMTFDGSNNAQQINFTLSGLYLNESSVYFQDSSVNIDSCTFEGSKRGVQFLIRTRLVSSIQITNSTFRENSNCISVVVNSTKSLSHQISQVTFKLTNSSFYGNAMSDKGSCMSFSESPDNNQSVSCNITLENITFSHNKFSSKALVFLELENGNQDINLQEVSFINNTPISDGDVSVEYSQTEFFVCGNLVNIFVNASNFTSQNARSFNISASHVSLEIHNSSFSDQKVEGIGGVVCVKGIDFCLLNVSDSRFVNTSAAQGGVFNVECTKVRMNYQGNIFIDNKAVNGGGGVVYVNAPGPGSNNSEYSAKEKNNVDLNSQSEQGLQTNFTKCVFTNAYSSLGGGAVYIAAITASVQLRYSNFTNCASLGTGGVLINAMSPEQQQGYGLVLIVESSRFVGCRSDGFDNGGSLSVLYKRQVVVAINNSHFISNRAGNGGALSLFPSRIEDERWRSKPSQITVKNATFLENSATNGGAIYLVVNNHSILILENVTMESNKAEEIGGAAAISPIFSLKIRDSRLLKNSADECGGALLISDVNVLEVEDSLFDGNYAWNVIVSGPIEFGGALYIDCRVISTSITIINTTFNNCSAELAGGAIYLAHEGNVTLVVKNSSFVENLSFRQIGTGGAISTLLSQDIETNPGCIGQINGNNEEFPSWTYKSQLLFEDTTFERNVADAGGALYLSNGKATFRNCYFVDNFASSQGGHIYTSEGPASLIMHDSLLQQTIKKLQLLAMTFSKASFIHGESSGALKIYNTTMDVRAYGSTNPLFIAADGREIDLGSDNRTKFNCPVGNEMEIIRFTEKLTTQVNNKPCKIEVTTLEFSCSPCEGNSYSLQRGRALGSQLDAGFHCLPCPFGANCSQNILAKRDFWGFEEQNNPPRLQFTMCPEGYCSPPRGTNVSKYNGCQGNRFGDLCGHCSEGYTETLYSTHCKPSHQCNDYWFWPVALAYVSLMALYFTFRPPIVPWIKRQILWFKEHKPEDQDNNFDKGYLKILFYFYQAANLLVVSRSSQYVIKADLVEPIVGLFNFKLQSNYSRLICPFSGLTVVTKQLFSASHVFGTLLMICAFYILHWGIQKIRGQGVPCVGPYLGGILQALLLGYTTLATVSFNLLCCVPIGTEKRLLYDGNVVCFQWWQYILIAFVCIFVVPFVFVLLWGSYKLYGGTLSVGKFLLACIFPLPSLTVWIIVSFFWIMGYPVNGHSTPCQATRNSIERVLYDSFKRPEDGRKLSLSWESIMIGRRLILVMMKAFVSNPLPRVLIMSLFCFLFLLHHVVAQPFRDSIANTAETISLLSIAVLGTGNVFFASFLSLAVPFNDHFSDWWKVFQGVEIVILCFAPAVFGLLVVIAVLSQLFRLAIAVCRVVCYFWWNCFPSCYSNHEDEAKPLLAPVQ